MHVLIAFLVAALAAWSPPVYAACQQWCVFNASGVKTVHCAASASAAYASFLGAAPPNKCGDGRDLPRIPERRSVQSATAEVWGYHTDGCSGGGPFYDTSGLSNLSVMYIDVPCGNDQCPVQAPAQVQNVTIGYTRGRDDSKVVGTPFNPWAPEARGCSAGCVVKFGNAVQAFSSESPTPNGMYRQSVNMETSNTGDSCSETTPAMAPTPVGGPPCVGSLGEVNGRPYCAGTSTNPVSADPPKPDGPGPPYSDGNPPAGSTPTPGQNPTPADGKGGPEGGPRGGGTTVINNPNGTPTGTTPTPGTGAEQANCGAPGQPKCSIDETGTPKVEKGAYDTAADDYKKQRDTNRESMAGPNDKSFFEGWKSFWFAPPVAECVPFRLPELMHMAMGELNPCEVVSGVRRVMAYVWALAGLWFCVSMVTRTIRGGA